LIFYKGDLKTKEQTQIKTAQKSTFQAIKQGFQYFYSVIYKNFATLFNYSR